MDIALSHIFSLKHLLLSSTSVSKAPVFAQDVLSLCDHKQIIAGYAAAAAATIILGAYFCLCKYDACLCIICF